MKSQNHQVPAFGCWDHCDDLPITQYFESAVLQAELIHGHYFGEDGGDLFRASATGTTPAYHHHHRKTKKGSGLAGDQKKQCGDQELQRKQGRPRAHKAVDEDLYKVPSELFYQKPKRKRLLKHLWSGCMRVGI
ncbi:hypothetical protein Cni_G21427 [Canna indica]|uniref:Uncharacterized protein n=1 Tax=Canna indica TaxID=4628 RepID=A0AAQ3QLN5_9LILI|nr:hypothetical protein Cni_G21427 [Canna indica]